MRYKTSREFFKNVKSKRAGGIRYYTITQVAEGLGVDWNIVCDAIRSGDLEKKLGFRFVRNSFNDGKYFPEEAISKLYEFKDKILCEG